MNNDDFKLQGELWDMLNVDEWKPLKNKWFADKLKEQIKHSNNCRCDLCFDNHEEAEEYDQATGFTD